MGELERLRARVTQLEAAAAERRDAEAAREKAELARRESEERYRALYENIPLMYFTLDADGVILSVNLHGAEELGYRRKELVGQEVLKVFHPEDHPAVREQFAAALESVGSVARWEFRKVRKDGSVLWVDESARAVRAEGHTVVLVVCEDVTERKNAEQKLIEHEEQLRTLTSELALVEERERRRIAAGLHDQIGQTLAIVKMRLGELCEGKGAGAGTMEELRDLVNQTVQATRSLTFELSSPLLYELGLEAALQGLVEQVEEQHGISCRFSTDGRPMSLTDDSSVVLYQVVRELLFNSVKHARARSAGVSMRVAGDRVEITVTDDGVGFEAAGNGESFSTDSGFGLLSIRERLRHLGGAFALDSAPGKGTRAVVSIPLAAT